jgi:hypothetical protein
VREYSSLFDPGKRGDICPSAFHGVGEFGEDFCRFDYPVFMYADRSKGHLAAARRMVDLEEWCAVGAIPSATMVTTPPSRRSSAAIINYESPAADGTAGAASKAIVAAVGRPTRYRRESRCACFKVILSQNLFLERPSGLFRDFRFDQRRLGAHLFSNRAQRLRTTSRPDVLPV